MGCGGDWDVDKYRHPSEPKHHWELKKTFMEAIKDRFSEQMVVCFAQTLGNIEFMGCRYPEDTMKQIEELAGDIVDEFREKRGDRIQRTFVSGSAAANSKVNRSNPNYNQGAAAVGDKRPADQDSQSGSKRMKYGNFVSASDASETPEMKETEGFILPPANKKGESERTVRLLDSQSDSTMRIQIDNSEPTPEPGEEESYRKDEVEDFFKRAFKMPAYQDVPDNIPENSVHNYLDGNGKLRLNYDYPLHNFIVVTLAYCTSEAATNILQRSAGFCKMAVHWEYKGNQECYVQINGHKVCSERASSKPEARDAACRRAIEVLSEYCYTVQIKNQFLSDGTEVDLIDVEDNTKVGGKKEALGTTNVGHKLLSLMGWSGGGLGRGGEGISEPITAKSVFGREGLGSSVGVGKHFRQKIQKIIQEYVGSHSPYDLVFTTGFDNEQRKVMHEIARRHGLKSKSFGKGDTRHLTITRKFDPASLLEDIVRRGGETEKYILIPPNNFN